MPSINIRYNYNTDETKIKMGAGFEDLPLIHQLDALQDGVALITELYNNKLKSFCITGRSDSQEKDYSISPVKSFFKQMTETVLSDLELKQ